MSYAAMSNLGIGLGLGGLLSTGSISESRYFSTFDTGDMSEAAMDSPVVLSGGFTISVDIRTESTSGTLTVLSNGDSPSDGVIIDVQASGTIRAYTYSSGVISEILKSSSTVNDGRLNNVKIEYSSGSVDFIINGVTEDSGVWALNPSRSISTIGLRGDISRPFDGIIANLIIDNAGVKTTFPVNLSNSDGDEELSNEGNNTLTYVNIDERLEYIFDSSDNSWNNGETKILIG